MSSQKPIGVISNAHAQVAAAAANAGIPFIGIYGVSEHMPEHPKVQEALAKAAPTVSYQALIKLRDYMTHDHEESDVHMKAFVVCKDGDTKTLRTLVDTKQLDLSKTPEINKLGHDPLQVCARYGQLDTLKYCINELKLNVNRRSTISGKTALHYAVQHCHIGCIKELLKHKADPEAKDNQQWTPLEGICPPDCTAFDISKLSPEQQVNLMKLNDLFPKQLSQPGLRVLRNAIKPHKPVLVIDDGGDDIKGFAGAGAGGGASPMNDEEEPVTCVVCCSSHADTMVLPCMHTVVCRQCSTKIKNTANATICLQCQKPITDVLVNG